MPDSNITPDAETSVEGQKAKGWWCTHWKAPCWAIAVLKAPRCRARLPISSRALSPIPEPPLVTVRTQGNQGDLPFERLEVTGQNNFVRQKLGIAHHADTVMQNAAPETHYCSVYSVCSCAMQCQCNSPTALVQCKCNSPTALGAV